MDTLLNKLQDNEQARVENRQINSQILDDSIKNDGIKGLKQVYASIYPELKVFFENEEKVPRYYRKLDTTLACHYNIRDKSPLFVFLPSAFSEQELYSYLGVLPGHFFDYICGPEPKLIPFIDMPQKYQGNIFYENLFAEWVKRLEDEHKDTRVVFPPLYGNVLQDIMSRENTSATQNVIAEEFTLHYPNITVLEEVKYDRNLKPMRPIKFFSERLAWLQLVKADDSVSQIKDLLDEYEKHPERNEVLELAMNFTFACHQFLTAYFFYSKGCPIACGPTDIDRAVIAFQKIIQRRPNFLKYLPNIIILSNILTKIYKQLAEIPIPVIHLPVAKNPKDAFDLLQISENDDNIFESKTELTKDIHGTLKATQEMQMDNVAEKLNSLDESAQLLSKYYRKKLSDKYEMLPTGICLAVEVALAILDPEVEHIVRDYFVAKSLEKTVISPLVEKATDIKFSGNIYGGVLGNLKIPLDIWEYGKHELPVVYQK